MPQHAATAQSQKLLRIFRLSQSGTSAAARTAAWQVPKPQRQHHQGLPISLILAPYLQIASLARELVSFVLPWHCQLWHCTKDAFSTLGEVAPSEPQAQRVAWSQEETLDHHGRVTAGHGKPVENSGLLRSLLLFVTVRPCPIMAILYNFMLFSGTSDFTFASWLNDTMICSGSGTKTTEIFRSSLEISTAKSGSLALV